MLTFYANVATLLLACRHAIAEPCFLAGQPYPVPTRIAAEPEFQDAVQAIREDLDSRQLTAPYNHTSFSISVFTTSDPGLAWQYHHTTRQLANGTQGTRRIDEASIYRIGSISKVLTVYLWLAAVGDRYWNDPISHYIPELTNSTSLGYTLPRWEDVTIGDLAGQMAGLGRDYGLADLAVDNALAPPVPGLPNPPASRLPACGYQSSNGSWLFCSEQAYVQGVANEAPIFPTAYTPVYSNAAFALLGIALSRRTGRSMESLFNQYLVRGLGLNATSFTVPNGTSPNDVIPGSPVAADWSVDMGVFGSTGGNFMSTRDAAEFGKAILNNRQLSPAMTRRWLKPTGFVEEFSQGVGRPWEIFRSRIGGHSVELYTKGGDWGLYSTNFALIPGYNMGFTVFTAFDDRTVTENLRNTLPNVLIDQLLPTVDAVAKKQAHDHFSGTYSSSGSNSSITVTTDDLPGLKVSQWTYNGTDIFTLLGGFVGGALDWRLMPNNLYDNNRVGFTALYQNFTSSGEGIFECGTWFSTDGLTYGNVPLGHFVFDVDAEGMATSVELVALGVALEREE